MTKSERKLNPKQEAFCLEFAVDHNGTQACIRAGYSKRTAGKQAFQLLGNTRIKARIAELHKQHADRCDVTVEEVMSGLRDIRNRCLEPKPVLEFDPVLKKLVPKKDADGNFVYQFDSHGANKAVENLGKMIGAFVDRIKVEDVTVDLKGGEDIV